jgi:hypothetical protein
VRWWGQTVGRIGFEVAATFVPVAGVAGKLAGGARAADAAVDVARPRGGFAELLQTPQVKGQLAKEAEAKAAPKAAEAEAKANEIVVAAKVKVAKVFDRLDVIKDILANVGGDFKNHPLRLEYEAKVADLKRYADRIPAGAKEADLKVLAEEANAARRQLGVEYKNVTPEPLRDFIYDVNKARYDDPLGPTVDFLRGQRKSYHEIIESAARPNPDVDALLSKFGQWLEKQPDSVLSKYQQNLGN